MDGMTINHIVSIDHGSCLDDVQMVTLDIHSMQKTQATPNHPQKHRSRHHGPMYQAHEPTSRFCMRHGSCPANRNLQNLGFFRSETNEYQLSQKRTIIFFKSGSFQSDFLYFLPDFPSFFASRHSPPAPGSSTSAPGLPLHCLAGPRHPGPSIATEGAGRSCGRHGRHGTVGGWGRTTEVQLAGEGLDQTWDLCIQISSIFPSCRYL